MVESRAHVDLAPEMRECRHVARDPLLWHLQQNDVTGGAIDEAVYFAKQLRPMRLRTVYRFRRGYEIWRSTGAKRPWRTAQSNRGSQLWAAGPPARDRLSCSTPFLH